jgi:hypothetical protein
MPMATPVQGIVVVDGGVKIPNGLVVGEDMNWIRNAFGEPRTEFALSRSR